MLARNDYLSVKASRSDPVTPPLPHAGEGRGEGNRACRERLSYAGVPLPACSVNYDPLMVHARDPEDPVTLSFASAIELARSSSRLSGRGGFGLDLAEFSALLDRYFPGARGAYLTPAFRAGLFAVRSGNGFDEFEDLLSLLMAHRSDESRESLWLAHAITACCMGEDHLWQDMGLPNRQALSDLLAHHFTALFARNTGGMRWKKFFYKQLCERNGAFVCRSPSCAECVEYANCFGPEEEGAWQPMKR